MLAPIIMRLTIERFRGVASLTWLPAKGTNVVLGGGDAGKTTILDASRPPRAGACLRSTVMDYCSGPPMENCSGVDTSTWTA